MLLFWRWTLLMGGKMLFLAPPSHSKAPKVCHICDQLYVLGPAICMVSEELSPPTTCAKMCHETSYRASFMLTICKFMHGTQTSLSSQRNNPSKLIFGVWESSIQRKREIVAESRAIGPQPKLFVIQKVSYLWWWCTRFVHTYATFFLWQHKLKCKWEHDNQYVDYMKLFDNYSP
jgi:hypothetical protein